MSPVRLLGLCLVLALVAAASGALESSAAAPCRSDERLVHTTTKAGPYGSEAHLTRALAIARLVRKIHDRLEAAGICYFATGRTLEGVWRHGASLPHHTTSADLAILNTQLHDVRRILLAELESSDNYIIEGHAEVEHIKVSILLDGKAAAHVNFFVYYMSDDNLHLVHPWLAFKPFTATIFPTKLATFHDSSIRVPADTRAFLLDQYGSELDSPRKAFSWTRMSYVTAHEGMTTIFPLVSVIIPTYERPQFLKKAIELVNRQDYPNMEIIVVDDGRVYQMDNPDMIAILQAPDVRYIYLPERCSIGQKRNIAVAHARGEIVVHWDDDDYFREHRISAQVAPIIRGEVDMTVLEHHYYYILSSKSFYVVRRASSWGPHFGTFVYRKNIFDSGIRYPDNSMAEDYAFAELALDKGATIYVMSNEDGKHVYVRHHNTWEFKLEEFDLQIKQVERPSFMSDHDWQYYSDLESVPMTVKPINHYSSDLIKWDRPELKPEWSGSLGYEPSYPSYPGYPSYYPSYFYPAYLLYPQYPTYPAGSLYPVYPQYPQHPQYPQYPLNNPKLPVSPPEPETNLLDDFILVVQSFF